MIDALSNLAKIFAAHPAALGLLVGALLLALALVAMFIHGLFKTALSNGADIDFTFDGDDKKLCIKTTRNGHAKNRKAKAA